MTDNKVLVSEMDATNLLKIQTDTVSVLDQMRQACKDDLMFLVSDVLGYGKKECGFGKMHYDLCDFLDKDEFKRRLVMFPRGHLKTTFVTIGKTIQEIIKNPDVRILIASSSMDLAEDMLSEIKWHFEKNERFRKIFPHLCPNNIQGDREKWGATKIIVSGRSKSFTSKESTITISSVERESASQHYDLIIFDDICNRKWVMTAQQMKKLLRWYKECLPLLERKHGRIIMVGTRWHYDDIYQQVMDSGQFEWLDKYKSCWVDPDVDDEDKQPIYPEMYTKEMLFEARDEMMTDGDGELWFCHYLNDPAPESEKKFLRQHWNYYDGIINGKEFTGNFLIHNDNEEYGILDTVRRHPFKHLFVTYDPALSNSKQADQSAICCGAIDYNNSIFILDIDKFRTADPEEAVQRYIDMIMKWQPDKCGIEEHGIGKFVKSALKLKESEQMIKLPRYELLKPIGSIGDGNRGKTKEDRINGLSFLQKMRKVYLPKAASWKEAFLAEAKDYPKGKHDDMLDAVAYLQYMYKVAETSTETRGMTAEERFLARRKKSNAQGGNFIFSSTRY